MLCNHASNLYKDVNFFLLMVKDYSNEVKILIKRYRKEDIEYGKGLDFLIRRLNTKKEEIDNDILNCNNLSLTEKQLKNGEIRYALFFMYSRRKGRKYVITFRESKLRIITIIPLGKKTLKRYRKKGLNI